MAISDELRKLVDPNNECCCEHCLSNKCKEWAYENDYYVYSIITFAAEGSCYLTHENNISKRLKTFDARNEPEAIFKACEYILNSIKQ